MPPDNFEPKLGRIRNPSGQRNLRTTKRIIEHAAKSAGRQMRQQSHISPGDRRRGTAPGVLARVGRHNSNSHRFNQDPRDRQRP